MLHNVMSHKLSLQNLIKAILFIHSNLSRKKRSHCTTLKAERGLNCKTGLMGCDIDSLKALRGDMEMRNQTSSSCSERQVRGQGSHCSHVIEAPQWWLIRARWKFPNVLLWDRVHTFHQMEIPSAWKDITALFTWMQNISQDAFQWSRPSHSWL